MVLDRVCDALETPGLFISLLVSPHSHFTGTSPPRSGSECKDVHLHPFSRGAIPASVSPGSGTGVQSTEEASTPFNLAKQSGLTPHQHTTNHSTSHVSDAHSECDGGPSAGSLQAHLSHQHGAMDIRIGGSRSEAMIRQQIARYLKLLSLDPAVSTTGTGLNDSIATAITTSDVAAPTSTSATRASTLLISTSIRSGLADPNNDADDIPVNSTHAHGAAGNSDSNSNSASHSYKVPLQHFTPLHLLSRPLVRQYGEVSEKLDLLRPVISQSSSIANPMSNKTDSSSINSSLPGISATPTISNHSRTANNFISTGTAVGSVVLRNHIVRHSDPLAYLFAPAAVSSGTYRNLEVSSAMSEESAFSEDLEKQGGRNQAPKAGKKRVIESERICWPSHAEMHESCDDAVKGGDSFDDCGCDFCLKPPSLSHLVRLP